MFLSLHKHCYPGVIFPQTRQGWIVKCSEPGSKGLLIFVTVTKPQLNHTYLCIHCIEQQIFCALYIIALQGIIDFESKFYSNYSAELASVTQI